MARLILLDQNVPRALSSLLPDHDVKSAFEMGWAELSNGQLLRVAEDAGFEAMVTADKNLRYQQSLTGRRLAIVVLSTNHWPTLQLGSAAILRALERLEAGAFVDVRFPWPRRGKAPSC